MVIASELRLGSDVIGGHGQNFFKRDICLEATEVETARRQIIESQQTNHVSDTSKDFVH